MAFASGTFTRLYSWVDDRDNGVKIRADRMDAEFDGIATALSTAILKDGTQTITADIPWGGKKITGLGDPTSAQDAATKTYVDTNFQPLDSDLTALAAVTDVSHLTDIGGLTLANGDIFYVSGGAITNLAKGTDGQYLSLSSGLPAWADVASLTVSGSAIQKGDGAGGLEDAVSGTDYAPATSGTAILKGDGVGGFGAAASGTDYAPATSGTAILKGDGSGGFANAVDGTDYISSAGFSLISTTDVSSGTPATVEFTGLDSYQEVLFIFQDITHNDGSNPNFLRIEFSHDGGSTYSDNDFQGTTDVNPSNYMNGMVRMFLNGAGNCMFDCAFGDLGTPSTTSGSGTLQTGNAPELNASWTGGNYAVVTDSAETLDAIRFYWELGANFATGTIKFYAR